MGQDPKILMLQAKGWARHDGGKEKALAAAQQLKLQALGEGEGEAAVTAWGQWAHFLARLGKKRGAPSSGEDDWEAKRSHLVAPSKPPRRFAGSRSWEEAAGE